MEIKDDVERLRQLLADFRNAADFDKTIGSQEWEQLTQRINAHFFAKCPGSKATVDLSDHAFRNLPTELKAGVTRLAVRNVGKEIHNLQIISRTPKLGVKESIEEILKLPADQLFAKVELEDVLAFALPGRTYYALLDVAAGDYVAVCTTTKGSIPGHEGNGPPHFTLGMRQDLRVT